ncbi:hypothetical protein FNV43_RR08914 [Rhamnella rubrinervis]|uniref:Uncharacterized protein n=1 Tax=Rhamnella rubrinervis TaxID=2594499 RepID=A0A8K0H924_9ROSA|nr:hypothetical protein FNV43_RR08914 [Rhamnella rubrinervis]
MAAPSPALSNNSSDTATATATTTAAAATVTAALPSAKATSAVPSNDTATAAASVRPAVNTAHRTDGPPKTLRGLNKPKCKQCGNVARSRNEKYSKWEQRAIEYHYDVMLDIITLLIEKESISGVEPWLYYPYKGVRMNHARVAVPKLKIHVIFTGKELRLIKLQGNGILVGFPASFVDLVMRLTRSHDVYSVPWLGEIGDILKANATFPDKTPPSSSPLFDHHSTEASPSGNSHRVASLRQLSNTFSQFNNVQIPLRSKKPLTRKDAAAINEWRFSKLKEYKDRNIEVENEAFDRYMQNISLLEEIFSAKPIPEETTEDGSSISNHDYPTSREDNMGATTSGLKLKLRSEPVRSNNFRKRVQQIVDQGLNKLQKCELDERLNEPKDQNELDKGPKSTNDLWAERASDISDLIDKLNKARNEEDLKSCLEVKSQLFGQLVTDSEILKDRSDNNNLEPTKETNYLLPRSITSVEIDQETLRSVDAHFTSLQHIGDL